MFIEIGGQIFNIAHITTVKPDVHTYNVCLPAVFTDENDIHTTRPSYMILINTVNFRNDNKSISINSNENYEYCFYMADKEEWQRTYEKLRDLLGIACNVEDTITKVV